jgi:hypothetical protein
MGATTTSLQTTFVNPAQLTAAVPANLLLTPGTATVTVIQPNNLTSGGAPFTITPQAGLSPLVCQTMAPATPTLRAEGYTERAGDIVLTCTGGASLSLGGTVPQYSLTLYFNAAVTSRLLPVTNGPYVSEALLVIDEPGSGLPNPSGTAPFGSNAPLTVCPTPLTGCTEYVSSVTPPGGTAVVVATNLPQDVNATVAGYNAFQGIASGNTVTWYGVPILAPAGSGFTRTIRLTNLRVNATSLALNQPATAVIPSISISGATSLSVSNPSPTTGFVMSSLSTSASGGTTLSQCSSATTAPVGTLTFSEGFPSAFKRRVVASSDTSYAGQGTQAQNIPGAIYYSESGFTFDAGGQPGGLADFGTRLKAQFNNVPSGVRLFVSVSNVTNSGSPVTPPAVIGGAAANISGPAFAQLVTGEADPFAAVAATGTASGNGGNVAVAEIPVVNGSASAVWEVVNTNPNANEILNFAVFASYVSNPGQNIPGLGSATVNLSYAPTPPLFSAASGASASGTLPLPRFVADGNSPANLLTINACNATRPDVHIDAPVAGAAISGVYTVSGWAIGNTTAVGTLINNVQILVDGSLAGTATYGNSRPGVCTAYPGRPGCPNVGFTYQLNTAALNPGQHTITVSATDSDSAPATGTASVTVSITAGPPSVHIDSPLAGSVLSGTAIVSGWALANVSAVGTAISRVQVGGWDNDGQCHLRHRPTGRVRRVCGAAGVPECRVFLSVEPCLLERRRPHDHGFGHRLGRIA